VMTRPSASSNVAIIFDESTDTLEIGYTQGNALDTDITMQTAAANPISVNVNGTISGDGSGLTALNATNIASGTLDVARIPSLAASKITTGTLDVARIPTLNQNTTGSAGSAATLTTPRSIGGVNFDGSVAIVPTTFNGATFSGDVAVDTDTLFVDTVNDRVGVGTTSPGTKLDVNGTFSATGPTTGANHGSSSTLYLLDTCFFKEWEYINTVAPTDKVTFNTTTEIPDGAKAVLAEVFLSRDTLGNDAVATGDHQIHVLGKNHTANQTNWRGGAGQPSTGFSAGVDTRQTVELLMPGESDGFTHYFGKWHSSVIIPLENNKIYYSNFGNSTSSGWVYVRIRGYYI